MNVYRERKINTLMGKLSIDHWTAYYVERIAGLLKDEEKVSTDRILEQMATHMVECNMDEIGQLLDGHIGGVKNFGSQEAFCRHIANRYVSSLQKS